MCVCVCLCVRVLLGVAFRISSEEFVSFRCIVLSAGAIEYTDFFLCRAVRLYLQRVS